MKNLIVFPKTDKEAKDLIPLGTTNASHYLYDVLREVGYSIQDAMLYVYNCQCHEPEKNAEFIAKYGH